jgi:hypothetical protein
MDNEIFPKELLDICKDDFIPRLLKADDKIKVHKKYYFPDMGELLTCYDVQEYYGEEYYFLSNNNKSIVLTYPVIDKCYMFISDRYEITIRHIINDRKSYKGYQIKWWFFKNYHIKYKYFVQDVSSLDDDGLYKIFGKFENRVYKDCLFKPYKNKKVAHYKED